MMLQHLLLSAALWLVAGAAPPDREAGVNLARRAVQLDANGNYAQAITAYDSAALHLPQLRDWLHVFAASSASFMGDTAEVVRRLSSIDPYLAAGFGWRAPVRAYARAGATRRAVETATAVAVTNSLPATRAAAWYAVAELQRDLQNTTAQRAALLLAIDAARVAQGAGDAARMLVQFTDLTPEERLKAGRALLRNGDPRRGARELAAYAQSTENAALRDSIRYEAGAALFAISDYAGAQRVLTSIAAQHSRAPDARFIIGRAQYRQRNTNDGLATLRRVVSEYPNSPAAARALFILGDLAQDAGRTNQAIAYFRQGAAMGATARNDAARALVRVGMIQYTQKQFAEAKQTFETYVRSYRDAGEYELALFWAAQSATALGQRDHARAMLKEISARHSLSYYDMRASELLGEDLIANLPLGPASDGSIDRQIDKYVERYDILREIGWYDAAGFELSWLRRDVATDQAGLYSIAEALNAREHAHAAIAIGRELLNAGEHWNTRLLRFMYPFPYRELIEDEARARGLDPYFAAALIRQESRFNPRAVSRAGAIGLMQVMPATGRQLGVRSRDQLMEPKTNIKAGMQFLADVTRMTGGRQDAVLVAYNAGPSRIARWRNFAEYANPDLFAERIPFDETRDYVKVVRVNTSIYHALYAR